MDDFERVNEAAIAALPELLNEWYPSGRCMGGEYRTGSLVSDEKGESASIKLDSGAGYDHASPDARCGDPIGLHALRHGCDRVESMRELAGRLRVDIGRPGDPPPPRATGLTLASYAEAKGLDLRTLLRLGCRDGTHAGGPAVEIPYRNESGDLVETRMRLSLDHGEKRFAWQKINGHVVKPPMYGVWMVAKWRQRKVRRIWVVEGESDCHTLWQAGEAALGIPGANMLAANRAWCEHLLGWPEVVVVNEGDKAGAALVEELRWSPVRDRLRIVTLADVDDAAKDPSALWDRSGRDTERFTALLQEAVLSATGADGEPVQGTTGPALELRTHAQRLHAATAPREIIVAGLLDAGYIGALIALPNEGKSLVAAELTRCVASGEPFAGRKTVKGTVIYACTDSPASTESRLAALDEQTAANVLTVPDLLIPGQLDAVEAACRKHECKLLVIDTWDSSRQHATGGYTEIDAALEDLMRALRSLCAELHMAVVITHHATRQDGGRARGSVVFDARADWIGVVKQGGQAISVTSTKCRDSEKGEVGSWTIKIERVGCRDVPLLEWDEEGSVGKVGKKQEVQKKILEALAGPVPAGGWSYSKLADAIGTTKGRALQESVAALQSARKLYGWQVVQRVESGDEDVFG